MKMIAIGIVGLVSLLGVTCSMPASSPARNLPTVQAIAEAAAQASRHKLATRSTR